MAAFGSMVLIIFLQQLKVPFMLEDLDYAKNLVTGEPLTYFSDITQSLGCIYFWKGGSLVAGFFLQVILLCGGYVADIINILNAKAKAGGPGRRVRCGCDQHSGHDRMRISYLCPGKGLTSEDIL